MVFSLFTIPDAPAASAKKSASKPGLPLKNRGKDTKERASAPKSSSASRFRLAPPTESAGGAALTRAATAAREAAAAKAAEEEARRKAAEEAARREQALYLLRERVEDQQTREEELPLPTKTPAENKVATEAVATLQSKRSSKGKAPKEIGLPNAGGPTDEEPAPRPQQAEDDDSEEDEYLSRGLDFSDFSGQGIFNNLQALGYGTRGVILAANDQAKSLI